MFSQPKALTTGRSRLFFQKNLLSQLGAPGSGEDKTEPCLLEHEHSRLTLKGNSSREENPPQSPQRLQTWPQHARALSLLWSKNTLLNLVCNNSFDQGESFSFTL